MPEIALSAAAIAVLRFRVRDYRMPVRDRNRDAFLELVAAGILEPDGTGDYRFTGDGWARRNDILRVEEDRIERDRFEPPDADNLSESARGLLRRIASGERVAVTDENRPTFRELAAARILYPVSTWAGGPESVFRFTPAGWERREEWITAHAAVAPPL
jgi:antitoxin (DNA-binding transcriptional repressor) of toxin-antitoxin stability system